MRESNGGNSMYFHFLTEILSSTGKEHVVMSVTCGHQSWLIVNSEVN